MRKVAVGAMVSLDGVMQAPGGAEEDPTGGFKFGGWVAPLADVDPRTARRSSHRAAPNLYIPCSPPTSSTRSACSRFPVLLGKGKRLFDESSQPRAFAVAHSAVSPNGVIAATYVRDGEVKTATVGGAQEPSGAELARREKLKREG